MNSSTQKNSATTIATVSNSFIVNSAESFVMRRGKLSTTATRATTITTTSTTTCLNFKFSISHESYLFHAELPFCLLSLWLPCAFVGQSSFSSSSSSSSPSINIHEIMNINESPRGRHEDGLGEGNFQMAGFLCSRAASCSQLSSCTTAMLFR